jgi:hypothetical protein
VQELEAQQKTIVLNKDKEIKRLTEKVENLEF